MSSIYLDHNATTPVRPEVVDAMLPFLGDSFGNPNSVHRLGQRARKAVEASREHVAALIGSFPDEVVFTSCGSESDALAIRGAIEARRRERPKERPHFVTSEIEHEAVIQSAEEISREGAEVSWIGVDAKGRIDLEALEKALRPETALVSIMWANNEIGTVQPIERVVKIAKERGVPVHSDAVQAVGKAPIDVKQAGLTMLSLSGHKLNAPKGVGALFLERGTRLAPLVTGNQERGRRGGTENVASIVGLGEACRLWKIEGDAHRRHLAHLRDRLVSGLTGLEGTSINGDRENTLPNTVHCCFDGVDGTHAVVAFDLAGVCVSSGSACSSGSGEPGHVLKAIGLSSDQARGALRISLGWGTTEQDIDRFLSVSSEVFKKLRRAKV